jgi:hypothetical protein
MEAISRVLMDENFLLNRILPRDSPWCPPLEGRTKTGCYLPATALPALNQIQVEVFWVLTCSVEVGYHRFRGPCCLLNLIIMHFSGGYSNPTQRILLEFFNLPKRNLINFCRILTMVC